MKGPAAADIKTLRQALHRMQFARSEEMPALIHKARAATDRLESALENIERERDALEPSPDLRPRF